MQLHQIKQDDREYTVAIVSPSDTDKKGDTLLLRDVVVVYDTGDQELNLELARRVVFAQISVQ